MRTVDSERAVLAVLALPLAAVTLAGGLLAVTSLDDARDLRRAQSLAATVPDLISLQQAVAAERTAAVHALTSARAASGPSSFRTATNAALSRTTGSLRNLRGNPVPASSGEMARTLREVRQSIDTGHATPASAGAGYTEVADVIAAVPQAVAATIGEDRLAQPTAVLAARLRTADAVAAQQLAGDRLLWVGGAVGRPEYDDLAGRTAALDLAVGDLDLAGLTATDALLRVDLDLLRSGAVIRAGATSWDAAGRRLSAALRRDARASADDVGAAATGRLREQNGRALAAVLGAVVVLALTLAHGLRLGRRMSRALEVASIAGSGEPYTTVTSPLGWGRVPSDEPVAPARPVDGPGPVPPPVRTPAPKSESGAATAGKPAVAAAPLTLPFGVPVPRRRARAKAPAKPEGPRSPA